MAISFLRRKLRGFEPTLGSPQHGAGVEPRSVVAGGGAGEDRWQSRPGELEMSTWGTNDLPSFAQGILDQRQQPLVAAGQFMGVRHGRTSSGLAGDRCEPFLPLRA